MVGAAHPAATDFVKKEIHLRDAQYGNPKSGI
jgi:hypothetical protein